MSVTLTVSIVTYAPEMALLEQTLNSLVRALCVAHAREALAHATFSIIDNGPGEGWREPLRALLDRAFEDAPWSTTEVIAGHGNVGYGRGHNLALLGSRADYHLVLNPDVILADDALYHAIVFMRSHADVGLLAPSVSRPDGGTEYLCKRYPSLIDLLVRGFAPAPIKLMFRARLDHYEMKRETDSGKPFDAPLASGCFLFLRRAAAVSNGGFCDAFFMYFEDFDLSLRIGARARIVCVPQVKIVHYGGNAAAKGRKHIAMFLRSALTFFNRNGWKLW